jgi:hypothetical protein
VTLPLLISVAEISAESRDRDEIQRQRRDQRRDSKAEKRSEKRFKGREEIREEMRKHHRDEIQRQRSEKRCESLLISSLHLISALCLCQRSLSLPLGLISSLQRCQRSLRDGRSHLFSAFESLADLISAFGGDLISVASLSKGDEIQRQRRDEMASPEMSPSLISAL